MELTPARALRAEAEKLLFEREETAHAIVTDARSTPGRVLIGIAVRGVASVVYAVSAEEWNEDYQRNLRLLDAVAPIQEEDHVDQNHAAHARAVRLSRPAPGRRVRAA